MTGQTRDMLDRLHLLVGLGMNCVTRARGDGQGEGDLGISAKTAAPMDGMNELFYNKN